MIGVVYRRDGEYLRISRSWGHTGVKTLSNWSGNKDSATLFAADEERRDEKLREIIQGATRIPAEEIRIIRLIEAQDD